MNKNILHHYLKSNLGCPSAEVRKKDMDALVDESYLEVAAEQLGYKSVLELKKKLSIKP